MASSSLTLQWTNDAFLSFKTEDTRLNFTDHLYAALKRNGIRTIVDLESGKGKAILESRFAIVILSKTYAFSTQCLDELVEIVECQTKTGLEVFPVFYDVDPSDVRKQKGDFEEAFSKHEEAFKENPDKVQKWRSALLEVGNISGWHLLDREEAGVVQEIVKEISLTLFSTLSSCTKGLIGISKRLKELISKIRIESKDVCRIVGICGMGGIGKTTLARVLYDHISSDFDGRSFLLDVREVSGFGKLVSLQQQLLSQIFINETFKIWNVQDGARLIEKRLQSKKVLIVIDDVNHRDQLKYLVGKRCWFGSGSRIIITSRDEQLLKPYEIDDIYPIKGLDEEEAVELFSWKAFNREKPPRKFVILSETVVKYTDGLPLAIEVLGSFFYGRDVNEWKSAIERLKKDPESEIIDRLRISFDGLQEYDQKIFLDIACFFKGMDKNYVREILDSCDFDPDIGIPILLERSLITIRDGKLSMHYVLQEMGWRIVKQESFDEPGERSRLWEKKEIYQVFIKNTGTEAVNGLMLNIPDKEEGRTEMIRASGKVFWNMRKLRLLKIQNFLLSDGLSYLSNDLRLLDWQGYPLKSLPFSFRPDKLVVLNMSHSSIKKLLVGSSTVSSSCLSKLKWVNLSYCQNLIETPDLRGAYNLESLEFEGCTRLSEIHPSISDLKSLKLLNLKNCRNLKTLPSNIHGFMKSLKALNLSGCSKIISLPEELEEADCLEELDLSGTAIRQPPSFIFWLENLRILSFRGCKGTPSETRRLLFGYKLQDSPTLTLPSLTGLRALTHLDISDCNLSEGSIPDDFGCLPVLEFLKLSNNNFVSLPSSISQLTKLYDLELNNCKALQSLPSLSSLSSLFILNLSECNLREGEILDDLGCLSSLRTLDLSGNNFVSLPPSVIELSGLYTLDISKCKSLKSMPELPLYMSNVWADGCLDLETLPKTLVLDYNPSLSFLRCFKLVENHNNVALTILKKFLQEASNKSPEFGFTLPGSEILEWFGHQSNGCSIKIESLPSFFNDNEWAGFAFCIVFVLQHVPVTQGDYNSRHYCRCSLTVDDQTISTDFEFRLEEYSGEALPSHQWISYMSHSHNFVYQLHKLLGEDGTAFELFFEAFGSGLEIEKCGIRLLYKSDVEELIHQGTGSIDEENHTLIKRKHEEDNEEDELGGNDRCDENPPHPKRFKRILDFFTWGGQSS